MRFDDFWPDDEQDSKPAADLPMPADGRHAGEIVRVRAESFSFMERHGAGGRSLAIDVQIPKCRIVESIVSAAWRWKIGEICRAARVTPPARGEDWDEQQLVGRQVVIETVVGLRKDGTEYCRVDKWHPQQEPGPKVETAAAPPALAATKRRKPAAEDGDDIPF
jgi:hypothetical protein